MKILATIIGALALIYLTLTIIGGWISVAIVVIGLLIGMLIPSIRQDAKLISMIRREQQEEKEK